MSEELIRKLRAYVGGTLGPWSMIDVATQAADALTAAEAEIVRLKEAWDWWATQTALSVEWDHDEEEDGEWRVHCVHGGVNDREWDLIATGETPLEVIRRAHEALNPKKDGER